MSNMRVGDVGTIVHLTVRDESATVVNLANSSGSFVFVKPTKDTISRAFTLETNGTDGKVQYTIASGDLDQEGNWKLYAIVGNASGHWTSSHVGFWVYH